MILEVPGTIVGKQRPRVVNLHGYARAYTPAKTKEFEDRIRTYWAYSGCEQFPFDTPLKMKIIATFTPPKSWSKKKQSEAIGKPHLVKPDGDNIAKAVCDALNGYAYDDDSRIYDSRTIKIYGSKEFIRIEIEGVTDGNT